MIHLINHVYGKEENLINLNLTQENAGPAQKRAKSAGSVWAQWKEISPGFYSDAWGHDFSGGFQVADAVVSLRVDGTSFI